MNSSIQQRINPPVTQSQLDFAKGEGKSLDPDAADQVDFLKLLNNSNTEVRREREAKKNGDFSNAKNYDDFLNELEKQTTQLREPKNSLDKDDFLKLFVTQLQHQDPLAPEDSTEMASRLAHFNSLEQMLNVNKTLDKMLNAQNQSRSVGMVSYLGKEITVEGGRIKFTDGAMNESTFSLRRPASSATLEIRNESGLLVSSKKLGTLPEGDHTFKWDGLNDKGEKVGNGTYTYSVVAKGINDDDIPVQIHTKTKITGVDIKSEKGGLFTPIGIVSLDDIKSIGEEGFGDGVAMDSAPVEGPPPSAEQQIKAIADQLAAQANQAQAAMNPAVETGAPVAPSEAKADDEMGIEAPAAVTPAVKPEIPKVPRAKQAAAVPTEQPIAEQPASAQIPG